MFRQLEVERMLPEEEARTREKQWKRWELNQRALNYWAHAKPVMEEVLPRSYLEKKLGVVKYVNWTKDDERIIKKAVEYVEKEFPARLKACLDYVSEENKEKIIKILKSPMNEWRDDELFVAGNEYRSLVFLLHHKWDMLLSKPELPAIIERMIKKGEIEGIEQKGIKRILQKRRPEELGKDIKLLPSLIKAIEQKMAELKKEGSRGLME